MINGTGSSDPGVGGAWQSPRTAAALVVAGILSTLAVAEADARQSDETAEQADPASAPAVEQPAQADAPAGILPIPDYTGDLWTRRALLGDFDGGRTRLAEQGIQLGIDYSNTIQSVVDGGRDTTTQYGGKLAYTLTLDLMRMGVMPGALIKIRGESRYGNSVNGDTGSLLPVDTDLFFPLTDELDEDVAIAITALSYTQFLSDEFGVFVGKFDTLDGDPNEFAAGRGVTQFMNLNLIFSPAPLITVPYSTIGFGVVWQPSPNVTPTSSVFNTTDATATRP